MDWLGYTFLALSLVWLALLSRRLGSVTHAPPYYLGLLVGATLVEAGAILRLFNIIRSAEAGSQTAWVMIYAGLPALGVTIALIYAWRYWSWLLAERD
jgi:hypothetical protein